MRKLQISILVESEDGVTVLPWRDLDENSRSTAKDFVKTINSQSWSPTNVLCFKGHDETIEIQSNCSACVIYREKKE